MADIKNNNSDSWELHFNVENEDDDVIKILEKDFTFELRSSWIISANHPEPMISKYNMKWYIRGSLGYVDGNKKYYNETADAIFNKHEFNEEIIEEYPQIKDKIFDGQFDSSTGIMKIF